jgi:putative NADH-flavin reductase
MKVVIFGATGSVGRLMVAQALEEGHTVTAFARDPAKLCITHPNLRVIQGDAMDPAAVEQAVRGQDAVVCALGAGAKGTIRSEGTRNIVRAMERAGVQRLVCQSSLGVGDSRENLNFFWKYVMFGMLLREAYADHVGQESQVMRSALDWTIVRPGAFTDGPRTGKYRHGFAAGDKAITHKVSRADVADFMLKQLNDRGYLRKTPALSY